MSINAKIIHRVFSGAALKDFHKQLFCKCTDIPTSCTPAVFENQKWPVSFLRG